MEKDLIIKTVDGYKIFGSLYIPKKETNKIVIFVHGFTGHKDEHLFYNASSYFVSKGYATFRFNLYAQTSGARNFEDTSISLHGNDISLVVKYFSKKYSSIFLVGHSYGGTSLLFTKEKNVSGFVFWDASYVDPTKIKQDSPYLQAIDAYYTDEGMRILIGKKYIEELSTFPDCGELISKISIPILLVGAGNSKDWGLSKAAKEYYKKALTLSKELYIVKGAGHCFNHHEHEAELFLKTFEWIKKVTKK